MWIPLTSDSLLNALTSPEHTALNNAAVAQGQENVLTDIASSVAKEWRGGLRRICTVDARAGYVPDELQIHILADFRYRAFTRIPGMKGLLDDLRIKEWDRANQVRDNLAKISIVPPDDANAETSTASGSPSPSIIDPEETSVLL